MSGLLFCTRAHPGGATRSGTDAGAGGGLVSFSSTMTTAASLHPARIEYLRVKNFRALRDMELKNLTPLTVLLVFASEGGPS